MWASKIYTGQKVGELKIKNSPNWREQEREEKRVFGLERTSVCLLDVYGVRIAWCGTVLLKSSNARLTIIRHIGIGKYDIANL